MSSFEVFETVDAIAPQRQGAGVIELAGPPYQPVIGAGVVERLSPGCGAGIPARDCSRSARRGSLPSDRGRRRGVSTSRKCPGRYQRRANHLRQCFALNSTSFAPNRHIVEDGLWRRAIDKVGSVEGGHDRAFACDRTEGAARHCVVSNSWAPIVALVAANNWTFSPWARCVPAVTAADSSPGEDAHLYTHRLVEEVLRRFHDLLGLAREEVDRPLIVEPAASCGEPQCGLPSIETVWPEDL